jgi:hypothetical protein
MMKYVSCVTFIALFVNLVTFECFNFKMNIILGNPQYATKLGQFHPFRLFLFSCVTFG